MKQILIEFLYDVDDLVTTDHQRVSFSKYDKARVDLIRDNGDVCDIRLSWNRVIFGLTKECFKVLEEQTELFTGV